MARTLSLDRQVGPSITSRNLERENFRTELHIWQSWQWMSGDGGFLFSANELETAVRLNSHLVHMGWIDGHYDMVGVQERIKYNRTSGVDFGPMDHVKYAEAFGATGLRIQHPDEIAPTLRQAFDTPGPVLIEVHVDYRDTIKLFEDVHEGSVL